MKRLMAILMTVLMCAMMLPMVASAETYPTPAGYNDNDYQKLVAFFEHVTSYGIKNGDTLFPDYDPADPETWVIEDSWGETYGVIWESSRVTDIEFPFVNTAASCEGTLDLSGFDCIESLDCHDHLITGLNLAGCENLVYVNCSENRIAEIDLADCSELKYLYSHTNSYSELDVSHNPKLEELVCASNDLETIDVTQNPDLTYLSCGPRITDVKMDFESIPTKHLFSNGNGGISLMVYEGSESYAYAEPDSKYEFIGWYDGEGNFLSDDEMMYFEGAPETLEARFLRIYDEYYIDVRVTHNEYGTVEHEYDPNGHIVTLDMTPNANCAVEAIYIFGELYAANPENPYVIEGIDRFGNSDYVVEIYVEFVQVEGGEDPTDPTDPDDPPKTGAASVAGAAVMLAAAGASLVTLRKKQK